MTDKEIIKALECCVSEGNTTCKECPLFEHKIKFEGLRCDTIMIQSALDLINRQQAEIERSNCHIQKLVNVTDDLVHECDCAKQEAIKEFAESIKAEIREALKSNYKAKFEIMAKPNVDMADEFISYREGKIAALRGIDDFVDTLISSETKTDTDFPKDYSYGY